MKSLINTLAIFALSIIAALALVAVAPGITTAQDDNQEDQAEQQSDESNDENQDEQQEQSEGTYTFTAQSGDSYSLIARKIIQIYGYETSSDISEAEIIAAETWLTQDADSPLLAVGQDVTINKADVKSAVDRAKELSDEAEALWATYAAYADFNTNSVGETS